MELTLLSDVAEGSIMNEEQVELLNKIRKNTIDITQNQIEYWNIFIIKFMAILVKSFSIGTPPPPPLYYSFP